MFDLRTFSVILVHMSVTYEYVDNISHFGLSVWVLTDKKVNRAVMCSSTGKNVLKKLY